MPRMVPKTKIDLKTSPGVIDIVNRLSVVEVKELERVYEEFDTDSDGRLSLNEIHTKLWRNGVNVKRTDVSNMIWEVDDDLDEHVGWEEFLQMYVRCTSDETGWEPRTLFNVVQFMMFDSYGSGTICVEDTLDLLFALFGREMLDEKIHSIFGSEGLGSHEQELSISLAEYIKRSSDADNHIRRASKNVYPKKLTRNRRGSA
eukprot:GHVN01106056.1.p2 GENE.GHVN01106056.1~~GHVN01106056.1.p2  ORF type:complete len:202 (+),score=34.16 GHVN01106056.1:1641-2246(+)